MEEDRIRVLRTALRTYYAASQRVNTLFKELEVVTNSLKEHQNIVTSQKEEISQQLEAMGIARGEEDWQMKYLNLLAMLSSLSD